MGGLVPSKQRKGVQMEGSCVRGGEPLTVFSYVWYAGKGVACDVNRDSPRPR